jgi:hypothetical protein
VVEHKVFSTHGLMYKHRLAGVFIGRWEKCMYSAHSIPE